MFGFYRVAAVVPVVQVGDPERNAEAIVELVRAAEKEKAVLAVFPEMCLTGYTCGDLFQQRALLDASMAALAKIARETAAANIVVVVGGPYRRRDAVYNAAFVLHGGEVKGIVPKERLPNYREFYEKRWFAPAPEQLEQVGLFGQTVPFGTDIVFSLDDDFNFAVELCEDLWGVIPPSSRHALAGATVIANLSASDEAVGKADYRRGLVIGQSGRCVCAYVYASAGSGESGADLVYGGHALIAENGVPVAENQRFQTTASTLFADVDCQRLRALRTCESDMPHTPASSRTYARVALQVENRLDRVRRAIDPYPFTPSDPAVRDARCQEVFHIQTTALAERVRRAGVDKAIVGVSGGLDSTLTLLVAREAFRKLGRGPERIVAVTMPGFGTTGRTKSNASALCAALGCDAREIAISEAAMKQFGLIGHDPGCHDVTYENVQARQRTMVLMNLANKENGLVVGTGDLSEAALGWSTFNGDHMSMYNVNAGVPKTLVRYVIEWVASRAEPRVSTILRDVIATPVSPELLPPDANGEIHQKTEEIVGPYALHDFFLYHLVKYGAPPEKILGLASLAFDGVYSAETIARWLRVFLRRFFSQQFKRDCVPDGPKVGAICLSPRGDWRMPSDASARLWRDF